MTDSEIISYIVNYVNEHNGWCSIALKSTTHDSQMKDALELIKKPKVRTYLSKEHNIIVNYYPHSVIINRQGVSSSNQANDTTVPLPKMKTRHNFIMPFFHDDIKRILMDEVPHNVFFVGPTGCGKTEYVHHVAKEIGMEVYNSPITLFQVNGRHDMETSGFLGDRTIQIDPKTAQNYVTFMAGPVLKAMTTGLNEDGEEIPGKAPAFLFIDEAVVLPSHILISLNRVLETRNKRREICLDADGGRVVRSHSGFRIILAANNAGRGFVGNNDALYAAQGDALDISTLNRLTCTFKFGYNRLAEKSILQEKIGDSSVVNDVIKYRDAIRSAIKEGRLQTPFSTRNIVAIGDLYRVWHSLAKALFYGVFNAVPQDEQKVYNELAVAILKTDIIAEMNKNQDSDFMD